MIPRRSCLAALLAGVALATPLLTVSPALAYGSVTPTKTELEDTGNGWKLNVTIKLGKKPATAHQPMRFVFTPLVLIETFMDDTKPGEQTRTLPQGKDVAPLVENMDVSFGDVQGNIWETAKFDFPLRREREFQAGDYSVVIQDSDGKAVGQSFKIKLTGKNTLIDRRAMVFAGGDKKKKPEEKKPDAALATDAPKPADSPADPTPSRPADAPAASPPPEVKPKQGGCGCQLPGDPAPSGPGVLALVALATGALAARSRR